MFLILPEPEAHRGTMHAQVLGNDLALPPSMGHEDGLAPVAEASVIGRFEDLFQLRLLCGCQPDPLHRFYPLSCKAVREGISKKRQDHPMHVSDGSGGVCDHYPQPAGTRPLRFAE